METYAKNHKGIITFYASFSRKDLWFIVKTIIVSGGFTFTCKCSPEQESE